MSDPQIPSECSHQAAVPVFRTLCKDLRSARITLDWAAEKFPWLPAERAGRLRELLEEAGQLALDLDIKIKIKAKKQRQRQQGENL